MRIRYLIPALMYLCFSNAEARQYTVRKGDTLSGIAKAHGIASWHEIASMNGNPKIIYPGQKLALPEKTPAKEGHLYPSLQDMLSYDNSWNNPSVVNRPNGDFANDSGYILMLRALNAEFSGRPENEVRAGIDCIFNRCNDYNRDLKSTLLRYRDIKLKKGRVRVYQFSCFSQSEPVYERTKNPFPEGGNRCIPDEWKRLNRILKAKLDEKVYADYANGANHYVHKKTGSEWLPKWAEGKEPVAKFSHGKRECLMFRL